MASWTEINQGYFKVRRIIKERERKKCKKGLTKKKRLRYQICLEKSRNKSFQKGVQFLEHAIKLCETTVCRKNCRSLKAEVKKRLKESDKKIKKLEQNKTKKKKVRESNTMIPIVENYLQLLNKDLRPTAREWQGPNLPVEGDNRPNWIRQCTMLEDKRAKINCLRKLREQAAMNPYYQHRIDRYIDEITNTYEPTDEPGTIPGNEFMASRVGEDLTEGKLIEYAEGISKEKWKEAMRKCHAYADNIPNARSKEDIKKAYWKCMSKETGKNFSY